MASSKTAEREARAARDRLRRYNARQAVHAHKIRRRTRDNVIWIVVAVLVIALAVFTQVLYFTSGPGVPPPAPVESMDPVEPEEGQNAPAVPDSSLAEARTWTGELTLNEVELGIELDGAAAPQAVSAFIGDVQGEYYAGKACHRLTDGGFFVLQCGSIDGTGAGDPDYTYGPIENAPADDLYPAGTIAMARAGGDAYSNGHQFFIVYDDTTIPADAAGGYSVIGTVTSGLDQLIEEIAAKGITDGASDGAPTVPTTITSIHVQ